MLDSATSIFYQSDWWLIVCAVYPRMLFMSAPFQVSRGLRQNMAVHRNVPATGGMRASCTHHFCRRLGTVRDHCFQRQQYDDSTTGTELHRVVSTEAQRAVWPLVWRQKCVRRGGLTVVRPQRAWSRNARLGLCR